MSNNDYILRSDAISEICRDCQVTEYCRMIGESCEDVKRIKAIPAADVEPKRKTGYWFDLHASQWVQYGAVQYKCSECGNDVMRKTKYCEECGTKMDAELPKEEENAE